MNEDNKTYSKNLINWFKNINWFPALIKIREHWIWIVLPVILPLTFFMGRNSFFYEKESEIQSLKNEIIQNSTQINTLTNNNESISLSYQREIFKLEKQIQNLQDTISVYENKK